MATVKYRAGTVRVWMADMLFPGLIPKIGNSARVERTDEEAGDACGANKRGTVLPPDQLPAIAWSKRAPGTLKLRPYFSLNGWPAVTERGYEVLQGFDLGAGSLHPLELYERDRTTPLPGPDGEPARAWVWNLGNVKDTFVPEESPGVSENDYVPGIWHADMGGQADEIAVRPSALEGPDVWVEEHLRGPVFLSGALGDALIAAGVGRHMMMQPARLLEAR